MEVISNSYLRSDYRGVIELLSDTPWPTTHWSIEDETHILPSGKTLIFDLFQSGEGELSEDGLVLTVTTRWRPRGSFLLHVGSWVKRYELDDDEDPLVSVVLVTGQLNTSSGLVGGPNIVMMTDDSEPIKGGRAVATLTHGETPIGYALGTSFNYITSTLTTTKVHINPGVIFTKFLWFNEIPASLDTYSFLPRSVAKRSGGLTMLDFAVTISAYDGVVNHSDLYPINTTHVFNLQGPLP